MCSGREIAGGVRDGACIEVEYETDGTATGDRT